MNTKRPLTVERKSEPNPLKPRYSLRRVRTGLTLTLIGLVVFLIGARPSLFGMDRSPVVGFMQIAVFLIGLALICIGGYLSMMALWKGRQPSIAADFGLRFVATGYVVAVFTGMADVFGLGSHALPEVPYFGPWQAWGVGFGQLIIGIGFFLLIPYSRDKTTKRSPKKKTVEPQSEPVSPVT
jgi:uncharacterized membrane protein YidH (DUF202 family)